MQLVRDEQGQDLIEYGLLVGIITVGAIAAIVAVGPKVQDYFEDLNNALPAADVANAHTARWRSKESERRTTAAQIT